MKLTVEMKLTHNLVLYCASECNTHKVLSGICHSSLSQTKGDFTVITGVDPKFLLYSFEEPNHREEEEGDRANGRRRMLAKMFGRKKFYSNCQFGTIHRKTVKQIVHHMKLFLYVVFYPNHVPACPHQKSDYSVAFMKKKSL